MRIIAGTMRDIKTHPKLFITTVIIVVALMGAAGVVLSKKLGEDTAKRTTSQQTNEETAKPAQSNTVSYDGVEGTSALELLQSKAEVVTKDSSYGPYVDSINGVVGGTEGKYWAFYVNGQMAQVGAADYITKVGDKIEWKFE